ncbi:MAG: double zinc ribbon domain-containing protein [Asticcacaulis sp.]|nr:double zinc ribbon domain-containing protein [Asticcacaulis sp.]
MGVAVAAVKGGTRWLIVRAAAMLFPPVCAGCRVLVHAPGALCGQCWPKLRFLEQPWCEVMGTPFAVRDGRGVPVRRGDRRSAALRARAGGGRLHRRRAADGAGLKYRDRTDLAPWMARWMLRAGAELAREADVVVPVPLHWRRFFSRRFNQSAELARAVARLSGRPFCADGGQARQG